MPQNQRQNNRRRLRLHTTYRSRGHQRHRQTHTSSLYLRCLPETTWHLRHRLTRQK